MVNPPNICNTLALRLLSLQGVLYHRCREYNMYKNLQRIYIDKSHLRLYVKKNHISKHNQNNLLLKPFDKVAMF